MEEEFEQFIDKRCERALLESEEYLRNERSTSFDENELQEIAEKLCYKKGFFDAMALQKCSTKM